MRYLLLVLVVLLAPWAAAQSDDIQPGALTFYGGTDCDAETFWIQTNPESVGTNCGTGEGIGYTWVLPETDARTSGLILEEGADVPMTAWIGSNTHGGVIDVTSTIYAGDEVVATAAGEAQYLGAATLTYQEITMTGTVLVTEISGPLRWEVEVSGAFSAAYMRFEEGRWSQFTLPVAAVLGGGPAIQYTYEDITDDAVGIDLSLNGSHHYQYNWTTTESNLTMFAQGNITEGLLDITVRDGSNTTVYAFSGNGSIDVSEVLQAMPGDWTIHVNATDGMGNLSLILGPVIPESTDSEGDAMDDAMEDEGDDTMDDSMGDAMDDGAGDANSTAEGEESPGLGLVVLPLLAAIALIRRR